MLEKTLESPLDCKEIQPVHPKGNQFWIFIGRTDAEAETPIFGHLIRRNDSFEKTLMLGNIEGGKEEEMAEDEMVVWHHWHKGHEFDQAPGVGDGQRGLECCNPWCHRVGHDWAMNWIDLVHYRCVNKIIYQGKYWILYSLQMEGWPLHYTFF